MVESRAENTARRVAELKLQIANDEPRLKKYTEAAAAQQEVADFYKGRIAACQKELDRIENPKPPFPFDSDRLIQPIRGGMKYPAGPTDA